MRPLLSTVSAAFLLALCASARADDATFLGTGIGAAVGGLVGSQFGHGGGQVVTTGIGIIAGGAVGNTIGHSIDEDNVHGSSTAGTYYYPSYTDPAPIAYRAYSPNYVAPPAPPPIYIDSTAGTYCREYSQEVNIGGRMQESYGTVCLQPDGTWRIVQ